MSESKERSKRQVEAEERRQMEEELRKLYGVCWFPTLSRKDIAMARPRFAEADVLIIGKQA